MEVDAAVDGPHQDRRSLPLLTVLLAAHPGSGGYLAAVMDLVSSGRSPPGGMLTAPSGRDAMIAPWQWWLPGVGSGLNIGWFPSVMTLPAPVGSGV